MTKNLTVIGLSLFVVFIAMFALFYIFDNISMIMEICETNKSLKVCTVGSLPIAILVLLLIAGGLIMVINIAAYIMISVTRRIA